MATAKKDRLKVGRPSKYDPKYAEQAYKLCLLGATDKKLADFFEVTESTINLWKLEHQEFSESLKAGKEVADATVAESLFNRAKGYSHPDTHISNYQGIITATPIVKHYPPDATSAIFWLKNRSGWRDQQEIKHEGSMNISIAPTDADL